MSRCRGDGSIRLFVIWSFKGEQMKLLAWRRRHRRRREMDDRRYEKRTGKKRNHFCVWKAVLPAVAVAVIVSGVILAHQQGDGSRQAVVVDGTVYYAKENLMVLMFLGVDLRGEIENPSGLAGDNGQSDMVWLIVLDHEENTVQIITIPRETMVEVEEYSAEGTYRGTVEEQICLQYAYGTDSETGCRLACEAVNRLLGSNVSIQQYFAVSMGAISEVVDTVGGVDVSMSDDYAIIFDGETELVYYTKGSTVHMDGTEAYSFVHYRDTDNYFTNLVRMSRQEDFLNAFSGQLISMIKKHPVQLLQCVRELQAYYTTNLSRMELIRLSLTVARSGISEWERTQIPGTETHVGDYDQYLVDEEALQVMILDTFYEKAE